MSALDNQLKALEALKDCKVEFRPSTTGEGIITVKKPINGELWAIIIELGENWSESKQITYTIVNASNCRQVTVNYDELRILIGDKYPGLPRMLKVHVTHIHNALSSRVPSMLDALSEPIPDDPDYGYQSRDCKNSFDLDIEVSDELMIKLKSNYCFHIGQLIYIILEMYLKQNFSNVNPYGGKMWQDKTEFKHILGHPNLVAGLRAYLGELNNELTERQKTIKQGDSEELREHTEKQRLVSEIQGILESGSLKLLLEQIYLEKACLSFDPCILATDQLLNRIGKGGWVILNDASGGSSQYLSEKTDGVLQSLIEYKSGLSDSDWIELLNNLLMDYKISKTDIIFSLKRILSDPEACGHKLGAYLMTIYVKYFHHCRAKRPGIPLVPHYFQLDPASPIYLSYGFRGDNMGNFGQFYIIAFDTDKRQIWRVIGNGPSGISPSGGYGQAAVGERVDPAEIAARTALNGHLESYLKTHYSQIYQRCQDEYRKYKNNYPGLKQLGGVGELKVPDDGLLILEVDVPSVELMSRIFSMMIKNKMRYLSLKTPVFNIIELRNSNFPKKPEYPATFDIVQIEVSEDQERKGHGTRLFTNMVEAAKPFSRAIYLELCLTPDSQYFGKKLVELGLATGVDPAPDKPSGFYSFISR